MSEPRQPTPPSAPGQPALPAPVFDQTHLTVGQQINIAGDANLTVTSPISLPAASPAAAAMKQTAAANPAKMKAGPQPAIKPAEPPPLSPNGLTWLHLSDWHQQGADFDRTVVRDALVSDIRQRAAIHPALAEVDFVIFSGDAAFHGKPEEFESARREFLEPVLAAVGLPPDKLFMVPGNHDLNRPYIADMLPPELQHPLTTDAQVQKWLTNPDKRDRALEIFKAYSAFVTGFTGRKEPAYANTWLGDIGNRTVGILCLNSAWMCARNKDAKGEVDDERHLTLGEPQLHEALETIRGADLRVAVLHHPFEWLARFDRHRVEDRLRNECHFILHGHEHEPGFSLGHALAGECGVIPAGASYDRRLAEHPRYTNGYNFMRLDFTSGNGVIFLRRWSEKQGKWIEDTDSRAGGWFPFTLPKELGRVKSSPVPVPVPDPPALPAAPTESPVILEYLRRLEAATSKLQLIGLGQGVQIELPIERAYIPLNVVVSRDLMHDNEHHFNAKNLRQREHVEDDVQLCDIFKWAGKFDARGVLLLGNPGAGKTTGARQFCWRALTETDLPEALGLPPGTIPVFLRLRQLTPHHLGQKTTGLQAFITDSVAAAALPPDLANPGPDLLARKGVLWVFDGLDEVVNENARVHVCGWLKQALEQRPDDFFLVTSRYQGYQGRVDLGPAFCQFHVKPLNETQVADFVDHWYRTVFQRLHGRGADIAERAEKEIASLMAMLREPEYRIGRLRELPANPLMLTILCVVHHQDRNLPRRRADLYARCVRVLIEHWRKELWESQAIAGYDPEAAEAILAAVAWWLHEQEHRTTLTMAELGAAAGKALADLAPGAHLGRDGVEFIRRMRDESGILTMWSAGQCGFLHLTFQEYLAGLHAAREGKADELVKHVGQSWWREVMLVAAAIGSREFALKFFTALVHGKAVAEEGAFVDQCLDEARYPVLEPFLVALMEKGVKPERQLELLHRLKVFARPEAAELIAACRDLARVAHPELAGLAREILQRAGIAVQRQTIEVLNSPLEVSVDSRTGIAFITIPAGEFKMGSKEGDSDEKPVHRVRITQPFRLGKYPVTNAEYERFLKANPHAKPPDYWNNSQYNDPQQPVVGVSWHDAQAFCEWAGGRLPSEAEWEYACRAGRQSRYCFGEGEAQLGDYAWYADNSGNKLHPVGQKKPNEWGLYDMHGNVWEWCRDGKRKYTSESQTDPLGPVDAGAKRVVRGGAWDFLALFCRAAFRDWGGPAGRWNGSGLRLVAGQEPGGGGAARRGAPQSSAGGAGAPGPAAPAH